MTSIKDNVDEALAGVKGELAIKVYGPDVFMLEAKAREIVDVLRGIGGGTDLDYEHVVGQPQWLIASGGRATARQGINGEAGPAALDAGTRGSSGSARSE